MKLIDADDVINRIQQYSKKNNTLYEFSQGNVILLLQKAPEVKINDIKSEAVREFAGRLKVEDFDRCIDVIYDGSGEVKRTEIRRVLFNKQIDNLVKEMGCNDG